jgi:hypothetical protein
MIETNLMRGWAGMVESVALFSIAILAIGLIVSAVKPSNFAKHLETIVCIAVLLLMLPAIMVAAWSAMSYWQHLGTVILGIMIGLSLRALRQGRNKR